MGGALTIAVLAVNAAVSAGSNGPGDRLARLSYLDRVRAPIERSTELGAELAQLRAEPERLRRDGIGRRMARLVDEARASVRAVQDTEAPERLGVAASLLTATLAVRAGAVAGVQAALIAALGAGPPDAAVDGLARSAEDMVAADRTYRVFVESLPAAAVTAPMPASQWVADAQLWSRPELAAFVAGLRSLGAPNPVYNLSVVTVTTEPAAVATEAGAAVLPVTRTIRLEIVVANTGNQPARRVTVLATLQGPAGELDTAREFVDLGPGQRRAVVLAGLRPAGPGPSNLTVTVGPLEGEPVEDNQRVLPLLLRA